MKTPVLTGTEISARLIVGTGAGRDSWTRKEIGGIGATTSSGSFTRIMSRSRRREREIYIYIQTGVKNATAQEQHHDGLFALASKLVFGGMF